MSKEENSKTYEMAFARLEEILNVMNDGKASLDDSLKLYEEADSLITFCSNSLNQAEQKIEKLIKTRTGDLALDDKNNPKTASFLEKMDS